MTDKFEIHIIELENERISREKKIEEGEKRLEEGKKELEDEKKEFAKRLKEGGISIEEIIKYTHLTKEEIEKVIKNGCIWMHFQNYIVIKNKKKHIVIYMLFLKEMKKWIIF